MTATIQRVNLTSGATTSCGGEHMLGFRVIRTMPESSESAQAARPRTLAQANAWLVANATRVDQHAKASTRRLIGRDTV